MGNCLCWKGQKTSEESSPVTTPQPHVNQWLVSSDFSSVPEPEHEPEEDISPEESVYRPSPNALQINQQHVDGYSTAPEDMSEEDDTLKNCNDGDSEYLTSDETENKRMSCVSGIPEHSENIPDPQKFTLLEELTDEDDVTPQLVLNREDMPVRPLPTPLRKCSFSSSVDLEKLAYKNGRAKNKGRISRLLALKRECQ